MHVSEDSSLVVVSDGYGPSKSWHEVRGKELRKMFSHMRTKQYSNIEQYTDPTRPHCRIIVLGCQNHENGPRNHHELIRIGRRTKYPPVYGSICVVCVDETHKVRRWGCIDYQEFYAANAPTTECTAADDNMNDFVPQCRVRPEDEDFINNGSIDHDTTYDNLTAIIATLPDEWPRKAGTGKPLKYENRGEEMLGGGTAEPADTHTTDDDSSGNYTQRGNQWGGDSSSSDEDSSDDDSADE